MRTVPGRYNGEPIMRIIPRLEDRGLAGWLFCYQAGTIESDPWSRPYRKYPIGDVTEKKHGQTMHDAWQMHGYRGGSVGIADCCERPWQSVETIVIEERQHRVCRSKWQPFIRHGVYDGVPSLE